MLNKAELLKYGLSFPDTYQDAPFHDDNWQLIRVKGSKKTFMLVYGMVAAMAGNPRMSRAVGNALHKNPDPEHIPCHRVLNAKGELADAFVFGGAGVQQSRLEAEGVEVKDGRVDLEKYSIMDTLKMPAAAQAAIAQK